MARIDKSDPINSTFRVHVAADFPDADLGKIFGAGLDAAGKYVKGVGVTGIIGVVVQTEKPGVIGPLRDVSRIDLMRSGCVTDFGPSDAGKVPGVDFGVAATKYYSDVFGIITATPGPGSVYVGTTVEPDRLECSIVPIPIVAGQAGVATPSARQNSTAYTVGQFITQGGTTQECTTAGTSASSAPTPPSTIGGTVTDGTAVFTRVL